MQRLMLSGGRKLIGEIEPSGSKNAALPVLFASLSTRGINEIYNVPDIADVCVALRILEHFGARCERDGVNLLIDTRKLEYKNPPRELNSKIRASSYLIGASLARFGVLHLSDFGGCNFCNRPIDMHILAARLLGADESDGVLFAPELKGARIDFDKKSVGATINAVIMAASAKGNSVISGFAEEPHVKLLIEFLVSAGADIKISDGLISVVGGELHGGKIRIIPDMIEAGTYMLAAPLTSGKITVKNSASLELDSFLKPLLEAGVEVLKTGNDITVFGEPNAPIYIKTAPHPGYPTDLQPQAAPLMARFFGGTIFESVWQNRFSYLESLSRLGVEFCFDSERAVIYPSRLKGAFTTATDLRGGAAAVLTALSADGESVINGYDIIERGYENLPEKLASLGADIKIIND